MLRRLLSIGLVLVGLALGGLLASNLWLILSAGSLSADPGRLQPRDVALVLGTSHYSAEGHTNRHFAGRVDAAAQLYHQGVVRHILASGANPEIYYNEPQRMLEALLERGVPAGDITLDYAGRRTLDSIIRARSIFGQDAVIIVSQPYHLYRALFLARAQGLDAQGFAAIAPPLRARWTVELREVLARALAVLDVYVLGTGPQLLGEPEPIRLRPREPGVADQASRRPDLATGSAG